MYQTKSLRCLYPAQANDLVRLFSHNQEFEKAIDHDEADSTTDHEEPKYNLTRTSPRATHRSRSMLVPVVGAITASLLLLITLVAFQAKYRPASTTQHAYHCGNSSAEARELGCQFDMLSYSWTPSPCYEADTAREFYDWVRSTKRHYGAFPFFFDENAQEHIPDVRALSESYGRTVHTTQEEHLGHCTFMMRRWHRLAELGASHHLNSRFGKFAHTKHCTTEILHGLLKPDPRYQDMLGSTFGISFETC